MHYGPVVLWFGVRRRASCRMVRVMHFDITSTMFVGDGETRPRHGSEARIGSKESVDKAPVYSC